jgi:hypothetical protein
LVGYFPETSKRAIDAATANTAGTYPDQFNVVGEAELSNSALVRVVY